MTLCHQKMNWGSANASDITIRSLPQIYEEFYHTVNNADHDKDLRLWSNTHGVNMAMNWPQFEVGRSDRHTARLFIMM